MYIKENSHHGDDFVFIGALEVVLMTLSALEVAVASN